MEALRRHSTTICSLLLLCAASAFAVWAFLPEISAGDNQFSDVTLHLSLLRQLDETVSKGGSFFDFWYDASPFGYPLFRNYQYFPHLSVYSLYRLLNRSVPLEVLFPIATTILVALLPWSFALMARCVGFSLLASAATGMAAILANEVEGYGASLQNFSWGSFGIITQLWAMVFLAPALGFSIRYLTQARGFGWAVLFTFLACGSHILSVYVIGFSLLLVATVTIIRNPLKREVLRRLLYLIVAAAMVTAHQWTTILVDAPYIHRSIHEAQWKFESRGISWAAQNLMKGDLLDMGRFPVLSLLSAFGLLLFISDLIFKKTADKKRALYLILSSVLWFTLLCGYQIWGVLFQNLPLLNSMHMHRFVLGFQLFCFLLIARAFEGVFQFIPSRLVATILVPCLLLTAFEERSKIFEQRHGWIQQNIPTPPQEKDVQDLIAYLKNAPRGWTYAGSGKDWARTLKVGTVVPLHHRLVAAGIPTMSMLYHSMDLAGDVMFDFDPNRERDYQLFDVRYVVSLRGWQAPAFLNRIRDYAGFSLFEYAKADAFTVGTLEFEGSGTASGTANFMRKWVQSDFPDKGIYGQIVKAPTGKLRAVSFEEITALPTVMAQPAGTVLGQSLWQQHFARTELEVHAQNAVAVFKSAFHPNWIAMVEGKPTDSIWITPGFLGVPVPVGSRVLVTLTYQNSVWKPIFFCLSALFALTVWFYCIRHRQS